MINKRTFLTAAAALAAKPAMAQTRAPGTDDLGRRGAEEIKKAPRRKARTTKMFVVPPSWANAISVEPGTPAAGFGAAAICGAAPTASPSAIIPIRR